MTGPRHASSDRYGLPVITFAVLRETITQRLAQCRADETPESWRGLLDIVARLSENDTAAARIADAAPGADADTAGRTEAGGPVPGPSPAAHSEDKPPACLLKPVGMDPTYPVSSGRSRFAPPASAHRGRRIGDGRDRPAGMPALGPSVTAVRTAVEESIRQAQEALSEFHRGSDQARRALAQADGRHARPNVPPLPLPTWPDADTDIDRWWFRAGLAAEARALPQLAGDLEERARRIARQTLAAIAAWERPAGYSKQVAAGAPQRQQTPPSMHVTVGDGIHRCRRITIFGAPVRLPADPAGDGCAREGSNAAGYGDLATDTERGQGMNVENDDGAGDGLRSPHDLGSGAADGAGATEDHDHGWLTRLNGDASLASLRSAEGRDLRNALADLDALVAFELMPVDRLTIGSNGESALPDGLITRFLTSESRLGGDRLLRESAGELCDFLLSARFPAMVRAAHDRLDRDRRWQADRRAALAPLLTAARSYGPEARLLRRRIEIGMRFMALEIEFTAARARIRAGSTRHGAEKAAVDVDPRPRIIGPCRPLPRR
ncbi:MULTISPECIES: hypothetical protein [Actinoalloteichus]|uniref:hypothetical protein n=1 Tax=Actinoalloteichus TaxID=65496 RepID=UPI000951BF3E|nr:MULTISPECIES: hypothetical protein [Actinoalloteichus]